MKLFEYEGKQLFREVGIPVPKGVVTQGPVQWNGKAVVKSQLLEGARGKRGLVKVTEDVNGAIRDLKGQGVETFLVEEFIPHKGEVYISAMLDRRSGEPIIVASPEGGIDVEESKNVRIFQIPLERGVRSFDVTNIEKYLNVKGLEAVVKGLYRLVVEYEAELAEINPLAVTDQGVIALDSKVILEDNALFRHQEIVSKLSRQYVADSYVELDGDVGIIGNGAGLTMATMDMVKLEGGEPADFYDVGGGANRERVRECVLKVGQNSKVKKIVVNIFGGITRCDEVAAGIVDAMKVVKKPMFVRLVGTNEEEGHKILRENGIKAYADALSAVRDAIRS